MFLSVVVVGASLVGYAGGHGLRAQVGNDPCFNQYLDDCDACVSDGDHRCGFCFRGRNNNACAMIVGDAEMPDFQCHDWVKPHLAGRPASCKIKHTEAKPRVVLKQKVITPLADTNPPPHGKDPVQVLNISIPSHMPPKLVEAPEIKINPKVPKVNLSVPAVDLKPVVVHTTATAAPEIVMDTPTMKKYIQELAGEEGEEASLLAQEKIEYDRLQALKEKTKYENVSDDRVPIGERERRHIEEHKEAQTEIHYWNKEQVQARKAYVQKLSQIDRNRKWQIQNREVMPTEEKAAVAKINADKLLPGERPTHTQFNDYLAEEDKNLEAVAATPKRGVRMQDEHFRHPEKKTAEDEIPAMAGSPAALAKLTSRFNDDNGHVSAANYKKEQVDRRKNHGLW